MFVVVNSIDQETIYIQNFKVKYVVIAIMVIVHDSI